MWKICSIISYLRGYSHSFNPYFPHWILLIKHSSKLVTNSILNIFGCHQNMQLIFFILGQNASYKNIICIRLGFPFWATVMWYNPKQASTDGIQLSRVTYSFHLQTVQIFMKCWCFFINGHNTSESVPAIFMCCNILLTKNFSLCQTTIYVCASVIFPAHS